MHDGKSKIRFGVFEADLTAGELRRNGARVRLQDQPFQVLAALLRKPGEVVTKEELQGRIWTDDTYVDFDRSLATAVNKVRQALGDSATRPRFIETVPKRGYRFVGIDSQGGPQVRRPISRTAFLLVSAVVGIAAGVALWPREPKAAPNEPTITRFTHFPGLEENPSFSPDGGRLAFVWTGGEEDGDYDVYAQAVGSAEPLRLTDHPHNEIRPVFSPDGAEIAFLRTVDEAYVGPQAFDVIVMPSLGGAERTVARCNLASLARWRNELVWSPDGRYLLVPHRSSQLEISRIMRIDVRSGDQAFLTEPAGWAGDFSPAISSDGRRLIFSRAEGPLMHFLYSLELTEAFQPKSSPQLLFEDTSWPFNAAFDPLTGGVIFERAELFGRLGLHRIGSDGGDPEPLRELQEAADPAVSADGRRIAFVHHRESSDWFRVSLSGANGAGPETFLPSTALDGRLEFSPDGKLVVLVSTRGGSSGLWLADADGTNLRMLETPRAPGSPRWSPDGKLIAFDCFPKNASGGAVFVIDPDGGVARRVSAEDEVASRPSWSLSAEHIYLTSNRGGGHGIWRVNADGSNPVRIAEGGNDWPQEAPSGDALYAVRLRNLVRIPLDGSPTTTLVEGVGAAAFARDGVYFTPASRAGDPVPLLFYREETGQVEQAGAELPGRIALLAIPPDRSSIFYRLEPNREADIYLAEGFR